MTREEMLSRLHGIEPGVELVALTSEYALERTFVCGKGFSYDWVSFDDPWPAIKITDITCEQLQKIKNKLSLGILSADDLKGSQLLTMYNSFDNDISIQDAFGNLRDVMLNENDELYVFCDMCDRGIKYRFFSNYNTFAKAFEEIYMYVDTKWEDLSDDDLVSWTERLEYEFDSIPLCEYDADTVD